MTGWQNIGAAAVTLIPLIERVNNDRPPIEITSRRGAAILLSRADYDALDVHLLRVQRTPSG